MRSRGSLDTSAISWHFADAHQALIHFQHRSKLWIVRIFDFDKKDRLWYRGCRQRVLGIWEKTNHSRSYEKYDQEILRRSRIKKLTDLLQSLHSMCQRRSQGAYILGPRSQFLNKPQLHKGASNTIP